MNQLLLKVPLILIIFVLLALCYSNCTKSSLQGSLGGSQSIGNGAQSASYDIVVYGGTPSGIMAAIQASRLGKNVILIEPTHWLGGMVTGGLSATDNGTWSVIGGLALEFFQNTTMLEKSRGGAPIYSNGVIFNVEPHIAGQVFMNMLAQANVAYRVDSQLNSVQKSGTQIQLITLADGSAYTAQVFIDSSYEGDLMSMSGVHYTIGREGTVTYGEPDAGVQVPTQISGGIDPYVVSGNSSSGLIFQVAPGPAATPGTADQHVMAYNYRFCVTDIATHSSNAVSFSQIIPANYSETNYLGVARLISVLALPAGGSQTPVQIANHFLNPSSTPYADGKFDINGGDPFSTDVVSTPDRYPDGNWSTRNQIASVIGNYDQGLFYYLATSGNVPSAIQSYINGYGICKDEFTDNNNFPTQLYVREGRRMQGTYIMTESDVLTTVNPAPQNVIGMGGYNMDSHSHQFLNISGQVLQEGNGQALKGYGCPTAAGFPTNCKIKPATPFPIPYQALTPMTSDSTNLLVSVTISASNMAYRAIRLEPQYMIMGQAAGAAASLAIDEKVSVQNVSYAQLQNLLLNPSVATQPPQVLH